MSYIIIGNRSQKDRQAKRNTVESTRYFNLVIEPPKRISPHAEPKTPGSLVTKWFAGVFCLLILGAAGWYYLQNNTNQHIGVYSVYIDNEKIGYISDSKIVEDMINEKMKEAQGEHPDKPVFINTDNITYKAEPHVIDQGSDKQTLQKINELLYSYVPGVGLKVDGKVIGVVADSKIVEDVLDKLRKKYTTGASTADQQVSILSAEGADKKSKAPTTPKLEVEKVNFEEEVTIEKMKVNPTDLMDEKTLYKKISQGNNGNTLISVKTLEKVTKKVAINPQMIVQKNDQMFENEKKIIRAGRTGEKTVSYQYVKLNGQFTDTKWVEEVVVKRDIPYIIMQGTKKLPDHGTGIFAWPVKDWKLTSQMGQRWGRTHAGVDLVSDNRDIFVADNGVVEFAGVKGGYGNCIIIDHKNGYKTLYGHLSKIKVRTDDVVKKGSIIGIMGNTGRSYGTHLHFEIRKNDVIKNPLSFLNAK